MGLKNKENENGEHVPDIFDYIGNFGPWQRTSFIVFFLMSIVGIWHNLSITFLAPDMEYWCVEPYNTNNSNYTNSNFIYINESDLTDTYQCELPLPIEQNISSESLLTVYKIPCTKWEYNLTYYSNTIVSEWDLVCDQEWLVSLAKSIYMFGFMASVFVFGQISDWIGRWQTLLICYVITIISLLLSVFSTSYLMFVILRFFQAFGRTGFTTTGYVLMMEIVGPKRRTEVGIAIQSGWSVGFMTLPLVAWLLPNWLWLQLALSLPVLPFICIYWIVPESPRWLLTQMKYERLEKVLRKAIEKNKLNVTVDRNSLENLHSHLKTETEQKTATVLDLFKTPVIRKRFFNMAYLWIVNAFVYYGVSYNTSDLYGNLYINFLLLGVLEIPSYILVFYGIRRFGRKLPLVVTMVIGGAASASMVAVPSSLPWLTTTLAMIGKFCITGSFGILYLYTTEIFPTVVRNVAVGCCSTTARVGSILAPFVKELGRATYAWVPNVLFAVLAISSGLFALFLPETNNRKTPDTLEEGECFGTEKKTEGSNYVLSTISSRKGKVCTQ